MERYRSGHNGAVLKTVAQQCVVGSNPTLSAIFFILRCGTNFSIVVLRGELAESVEGARLLSEYTVLKLYRGFESLALRHKFANS